MGISSTPAFKALYPKINWRYKDLKNGPQLKANPFKNWIN